MESGFSALALGLLRYDVDDSAHGIASVKSGTRPLDDFDVVNHLNGNLENGSRAAQIACNGNSINQNLYIGRVEALHRD